MYLKYYIIYHTSEVYTRVQKMHIFPPKNEGQANLHPPIIMAGETPIMHGDVSPRLGAREGRKHGVFMNPRVIPTCIAFWPGKKEWSLVQKRLYVGTLL